MGMHRRSGVKVWGFGPIRWASRIHARARSHTTGAVLGISRIGRHIYGAVKSNGPLADDFALLFFVGNIVIFLSQFTIQICPEDISMNDTPVHFCFFFILAMLALAKNEKILVIEENWTRLQSYSI